MVRTEAKAALPIWLQVIRAAIEEQKVTHESLVSVLGVTTRGAVGHYLNNRRELSVEQLIALTKELNLDIQEVTGLSGKPNVKELCPGPVERLSRAYQDLMMVEADCLRATSTDTTRARETLNRVLEAKLAINKAMELASKGRW